VVQFVTSLTKYTFGSPTGDEVGVGVGVGVLVTGTQAPTSVIVISVSQTTVPSQAHNSVPLNAPNRTVLGTP
jgi:hypothetical protein